MGFFSRNTGYEKCDISNITDKLSAKPTNSKFKLVVLHRRAVKRIIIW